MEGRLLGLDALRGIAALIIAVGHAHFFAGGTARLFEHGYLAVDLFFMLSGYVMARTYEHRFAAGMTREAFYLRRLKRLWPTMAIGALLGFFVYAWNGVPGAGIVGTLMAVALLPAFVPGNALFPGNLPAWSILFELVANFAHGLAPKARTSVLAVFALGCAALLVLLSPGTMDRGAYPSTFWLGFPRVAFGYCTGIVLWRVLRDRPFVPAGWALAAFPAAIFALPYLSLPLEDHLFAFMLCPLLIAAALGRVGTIGRCFAWLGGISFPLYATHYPVVYLATEAGGLPIWAAVALALGIAWTADALLHRRLTPRVLPGAAATHRAGPSA